jgi:hypothetical protein
VKFLLNIPENERAQFVAAVCEEMVARGEAVVLPPRTEPFDMKELKKETKLSDTQLRRMAEPGGPFQRVPGVSSFLVTVSSVRQWQGFERGAK